MWASELDGAYPVVVKTNNTTDIYVGMGPHPGPMWVTKYSGQGNKVWERTFGSRDRDDFLDIAVSANGQIYALIDSCHDVFFLNTACQSYLVKVEHP